LTTQSLAPQSSKARDPKLVELSQRPDGSYGALSSDGATIYTVRVFPVLSCQCKGFAARESCCHVLAAQRYGRPCDWCNRLGDVVVYANGWDNGAELALCNPCLEGK
jgi:hypothetical protein